MQGWFRSHSSRVFASDGRKKSSTRVVIIHPVVVLTVGLLCAVQLGILLQCAALSLLNPQPFHVDPQSTMVAVLASLDGFFRARISLERATRKEREGRDMERLGARGDAPDRLLRSKTGADTWTTTAQKSVPSATCVRRRPLGSKGGAREEHWCGSAAHSVATLWLRAEGADGHRSETARNAGTEREAEGQSRGVRVLWNPTQQVLSKVGPGTDAPGQHT